ncbi:unnamed protein product [Lathyrus sativus]|nr:unnamed protein product [Lathyrus sativus]
MAVKLVGSALLSAFLQVTFEKLASEIEAYFQGRKLNGKLLKRLNITLLSINAVVDDAEQKQIKDRHVKTWLDAVKDAVFEAEDILDEIDIEVSRCKLEAEPPSRTSKVWNFFNASSSSFDKEFEYRLQEIFNNIDYLASKTDILGLKKTGTSSSFSVVSDSHVLRKLPSTSLLVDSHIYGRDVDKETICNWLTSDVEIDNYQLSVVSIVGMGGMGKTMIAQYLYNDPEMEGKFDVKAWTCVSEEFDVFKVTRAILEGITGSMDDSRDLNMVQERLKEKLTAKRFLLVLDDLWNERRDQWEALQIPFNFGAQGSKILVTTRSLKVASTTRSSRIHQLEQLKKEHCWKLFSKHAFLDDNPLIDSDFKEIAKEIIEKCQGLPLSLKTIGSLLYRKSSLLEWEGILASKIWDLREEESNIIPAFILSYHHLPSHLKRCFAFCALFPKKFVFENVHLVLFWMAENFLQCPHQNMSMEEVGEQYFNELFWRSFFQISRQYEMDFIMHDLLNDLTKYACGDFYFTFNDEESHILRNTFKPSKVFETLPNANRLRTYLPLSTCDTSSNYRMSSTLMQELFSKFKFFRVLSLSGCSFENELPDSIGNLKHLRYLDLSFTFIEKLPDSVCSLYNLQILKLRNCWCLKELPLNLHKLTNLQYLDFSGTIVRKMPRDMEKLKNLHVLSSFYVEKGSEANIKQLGELNLHEKFSISNLQNIINPSHSKAANFKNKIHFVKLELEWNAKRDDSEKERELFEKLQAFKKLRELSINSYGGTRFPEWFGNSNSFFNVVSLKLSNCENIVLLPPLGILPSLKKLWITGLSGIVVIGSAFYGNGSSSFDIIPFVSLLTLSFKDMKGWEKWDCKTVSGAFPCLQKLSIQNCPNLKECLPVQLPCLMKLEISYCQRLVTSVSFAPAIHKLELFNCGKLQLDYHPAALQILKIGGNCMGEMLPEWIGHTLSHAPLVSLEITDFPTLTIPLGCCYNFLRYLGIDGSCDSLRTFPLDFFPELQSLSIVNCSSLEMILQECDHRLSRLEIFDCPKFVSFPKGGFFAPNLKYFEICELENLKSLPECMNTLFPSLTNLTIEKCSQLESFPDGGLPSSLEYLHLNTCSKLLVTSLKRALGINTSLIYLHIGKVDLVSFPDQGFLPLSLTSLYISDCVNLKKLDYRGLCHPSSLEELHLADCHNLQCLPVEGLPKSISTLQITNCFLLKQQCMKPNGEDWGKISHIQSVKIDYILMT